MVPLPYHPKEGGKNINFSFARSNFHGVVNQVQTRFSGKLHKDAIKCALQVTREFNKKAEMKISCDFLMCLDGKVKVPSLKNIFPSKNFLLRIKREGRREKFISCVGA